MMDVLVTRSEAAKLLHVKPQTISNYAAWGWLSVIRRKYGTRRTRLFFYEKEVLSLRGDVTKISRMEKTVKEIGRNVDEADSLLKRSFDELLGARRSLSLMRKLMSLVSLLVDKTARTAGTFSPEDREVLSLLLVTGDKKAVQEKLGLSDEGVNGRVRAAIVRLARAKATYEIIDEKERRIQDLERRNAELEVRLASFGKSLKRSEEETDKLAAVREKLLLAINRDDLSPRAYNGLRNRNIRTIGDLVQYSRPEVKSFRNLGEKSMYEIDQVVYRLGLDYSMDVSRYGVVPHV